MLTIGVLNNVADAAVRSTTRQFSDLLNRAAGGPERMHLRWFSIPPRDGYEPLTALWATGHLDGLIMTGMEPRTRRLDDEVYWEALTQTIEWAARHTTSTLLSCLAAHVAVMHLDGVQRTPLAHKLSGLFPGGAVSASPLLRGLPSTWWLPHSRNNDLPLHALIEHDYRILGQSPEAGVELFEKTYEHSHFIFLQSHPEYDAGALMREYRRDVRRYLTGERDVYPDIPANYFDTPTVQGLTRLRGQARRTRHLDAMAALQALIEAADLTDPWRANAVQLFRNWLHVLHSGADVAWDNAVEGGQYRHPLPMAVSMAAP